MYKIKSKDNSKIKDLIKLRDDSKFRNDKSLFYVEGERILNDTPVELIECLFVKESKYKNFEYIIKRINDNATNLVSDEVFDKIKDTKNSQGIVGIIKYKNIVELNKEYLKSINNCIVLDNVSDPGNLGTIIRVAEATNIDLIILCNNCCNLFNTKVIRSCMSSIFRLKFFISDNPIIDISNLKNNGFKIYSTVLKPGADNFNRVNYCSKSTFIFGNEANGISDDLINISDYSIYIPMRGKIESLNVAMSVTAVCYELMRQHNYYET